MDAVAVREPRERCGDSVKLHALFTLAALTLTGCGASALDTTINVVNTLGGVASAAGEHVNADFAKDDRACLYQDGGAAVTTTIAQQAACLDRIRVAYAPALKAYDDFLAVWKLMAVAIHDAQASQALGRNPSLEAIALQLPELYKTADALAAVYRALLPSLAPLQAAGPATTAAPAPGTAPTSTAAPAVKGSK